MLSKLKDNALTLATIGLMVMASVVYLTAGVAVTSGSSWNTSPTATPTPAPTPCTPDDPKKPCPTPTPLGTPVPAPSPTMEQ